MIPAEVSLESIKTELTDALAYAASVNLEADVSTLSATSLRFYVTFHNRAGVKFYAEFNCADYPVLPPTIEFVDESRTHRGARQLYPNVFHATPCVCMRYNRKAHGEMGGPHREWRLIDWKLATPGGGPIDSLAMMISDMHVKILNATGRMS
ncbi:MAG TPA: hypothetical protein VF599_04520 [Pyrinomonadaceae bacterium]|jgi:hypothetical protein